MAKVPCPSCKGFYEESTHFIPSKSKWSHNGKAELCISCIEEKLNIEDLNDVDSLFRYLNLPFYVDKWLTLYETNGARTLRTYVRMFIDGEYDNTIDWGEQNARWKEIREKGELEQEIPMFQENWLTNMRLKWQGEYAPEELQHLEYLYNNLLKSQNILPGLSESFALMLCKLILGADKDLRAGKPVKDRIAEIKNLMAVGGFETKGSRNTGDFDTMGELVVWLEKKGWQPSFYDGKNRDEVDIIMKDTQAFLRRLVMNEPALADQVQQRKEAFIASKQLESEVFMDEKEFDNYENSILASSEYIGEMDLDLDDDDEEDDIGE